MKKYSLFLLFALLSQALFAQQESFIKILKDEANRNLEKLKEQPVPAYYVSYRVYDTETYRMGASFGKLMFRQPQQYRLLHTMVRVGDYRMDNTHELKSNDNSRSNGYDGYETLPIENNPPALQRILWKKTDQLYRDAAKQYQNVKANIAVKVAAEDKSDDFSQEAVENYYEKTIAFKELLPNLNTWEEKLKKISNVFTENKEIHDCGAYMEIELVRKSFADTEGREIEENAYGYRLSINASTTADDGMNLPLYKTYFVFSLKDLPSDEQVINDAREMSKMISALRRAPVAESYSGPILMTAKASGVFFHEIFGHRIEGARMKQETDAQTFKKKVGQLVLPNDFSIIFDPNLKEYKKLPLSGYYMFDDEGIRGQRTAIVENGILKSFLMSRVPIEGFDHSNGHGRGMVYLNPVTRQSNMIIESQTPKSEQELREMLIAEAKKDHKEYGYIIDQVAGGFTQTGRYMPNAFNVTPLVVYRIYTDGRPDELVRGVDLVGTPLAMFSQIEACGNEYEVFNGYCGAESGSIPVSCVAPTIFVKMVETQKKSKAQDQPPILERP